LQALAVELQQEETEATEIFFFDLCCLLTEFLVRLFSLGLGETLFAPRNVPHRWAHVGGEPGTLFTTVSPAGTFETFILDTTTHPPLPAPDEIEKAFASHGMKVVGPPL
jgi:hypothetical protein